MGKSDATGLQDYERRELAERVAYVVDAVRRRGDDALRDALERDELPIPERWRLRDEEIGDAIERVTAARLEELRTAQRDAMRFAQAQRGSIRDVEVPINDGLRRGLFHMPLASAALVVPRGAERCLDSVHVSIATARAAGVRRVVACASPDRGSARWCTLVAAMALGGVDEIHAITGAAAVAALAFGTETIDPVDLVVGPAQPAISEAKRRLFGERGIDLRAPTGDLLVIADDSADADALAEELLRAVAGGRGCRVTLIATSSTLAARATSAIAERAGATTAAGSAGAAWRRDGSIRVVSSRRAACELANRYAPERLELAVEDPRSYASAITRSGSVYLGGGTALSEEPLVPGGGGMRSVRDLEALWIGRFMRQVPWHERVEPAGEASGGDGLASERRHPLFAPAR